MALVNAPRQVAAPQIIVCGGQSYYNAEELRAYDAAYFTGCARTVRAIVRRKAIPAGQFKYATLSKMKGWSPSTDQAKPSPKATLLLLEAWVTANVPRMAVGVAAEYECPEAPPILALRDNEKFRNDKGEAFDIETCGERTADGIYFLGTDVARVFNMPKLCDTMVDKNTGYVVDEHYKMFTRTYPQTLGVGPSKRRLYLTYEGMIKMLYSAYSASAKTFRRWATATLFTCQMGGADQKEDLASDILGIPVKSLRAVLKASARSVPCVYMFSLGKAKDLRGSLSLPAAIADDSTIVKYGFTDDLARRAPEHARTYGRIAGVKIGLLHYAYVDPKFLSEAESDIRGFFKAIETPVVYEAFAELVAVQQSHERLVRDQFKMIGANYSGAVTELVAEIKELRREHAHALVSRDQAHALVVAEKNHIIEVKDHVIALRDKEIENLGLKMRIASLTRGGE